MEAQPPTVPNESEMSQEIPVIDSDFKNASQISEISTVNPEVTQLDESRADNVVADAPSSLIEDDSDSEDEEHALNKSMHKISARPGNALNRSFGLTQLLSEESAKIRFPKFHVSHLLNQKQQMIDLNEILRAYMKDNQNLDDEIHKLADQIRQSKQDRQNAEQGINGEITEITKTKVEVEKTTDTLKRVTQEEKVLEMKNNTLERECKRCQFEIDALQMKIAALNNELADVNNEIEANKKEIAEELEPAKDKLNAEREEVSKETRMKVIELIKNRKRNGLEPYNVEFSKREPTKDLQKLLEEYRRECLRVKQGKTPEDLLKLQKEVLIAQQIDRELSETIHGLEKTQEELTRTFIHIDSEIQITESKIKATSRQIQTNAENYIIELRKIDHLITYYVRLHDELSDDYDEAYEYLMRVILKDFGKKDRIDDELKAMGIMLDWGKVKAVQDAIAARKESTASNNSSGKNSNSGSMKRNNRSKRGSRK